MRRRLHLPGWLPFIGPVGWGLIAYTITGDALAAGAGAWAVSVTLAVAILWLERPMPTVDWEEPEVPLPWLVPSVMQLAQAGLPTSRLEGAGDFWLCPVAGCSAIVTTAERQGHARAHFPPL